uniref:Uncharacterized protein n=1 Tax=Aegilops tauschii TaxID=37682 RepID=M8BBS5_AEGTA
MDEKANHGAQEEQGHRSSSARRNWEEKLAALQLQFLGGPLVGLVRSTASTSTSQASRRRAPVLFLHLRER